MYDYYNARASLIDQGYAGDQPEWVSGMIAAMQAALKGRRVLEIACGTGHWTMFAAEVAERITAVDIAPNMLAIAQCKKGAQANVLFQQADAYALDALEGSFNGGLAMQWLSHVPIARYDEFFSQWHGKLGPGAVIFMADNIRRPDDSDPLYSKPGSQDTYELRTLPDGTRYEIIKNYFDAEKLCQLVTPLASDVQIHFGRWWWWATYTL